MGIEVRFVDSSEAKNFESQIDENTRLLYTESIGNPKNNIDDFEAIAAIAHKHHIPFVVDNTVSPLIFARSSTGSILRFTHLPSSLPATGPPLGEPLWIRGRFDWSAGGKFSEITEPGPVVSWGYELLGGVRASRQGFDSWGGFHHQSACVADARHGAVYFAFQLVAFSSGSGDSSSAYAASLRERHGGGQMARKQSGGYLGELSGVVESSGLRPRLQVSAQREREYLRLRHQGGLEAGKKIIGAVKLFSHLANIGDAKSLIIHPAIDDAPTAFGGGTAERGGDAGFPAYFNRDRKY